MTWPKDRRHLFALLLIVAAALGGVFIFLRPQVNRPVVSPTNPTVLDSSPSVSPFAGIAKDDSRKILGTQTQRDQPGGSPPSVSAPSSGSSNNSSPTNGSSPQNDTSVAPSASSSTNNLAPTSTLSSPPVDNAGTVAASPNAVSLDPDQQAVADASTLVTGYLKSDSFGSLYNLMSADFKNTFSRNDFESGFLGSRSVLGGSIVTPAQISGQNREWGQLKITLKLADGLSQNYLEIFHKENGAWTLFGTQEE